MTFRSQSNILIDGKGEPLLADFGLSVLQIELTGKLYPTSCKPGNVRWAAPELLIPLHDGTPCRACVKSDIYSVGCVMLQVSQHVMIYYRFVKSATQVLSGRVPYDISGWNDYMVIGEKLKGKEPLRHPEAPVDNRHWAFMRRCWRQKQERTVTVEEIGAFIERELAGCSKK